MLKEKQPRLKVAVAIVLAVLVMVITPFATLSMWSQNVRAAFAHPMIYFEYWDLVDSGYHLDWSGSTKYSTQWNNAVNQWNAAGRSVVEPTFQIIRKDTSSTVLDMKISDVHKPGTDWVGMAYPANVFGVGKIEFNKSYLDNSAVYTSDMILHTCLHEIGHALGLIHEFGPVMSITQWPPALASGDINELRCVYERWWK